MVIARIPADVAAAPAHAIHLADRARDLGYTNVHTGYEPPTGTHVVTGTPPQIPNHPGGDR